MLPVCPRPGQDMGSLSPLLTHLGQSKDGVSIHAACLQSWLSQVEGPHCPQRAEVKVSIHGTSLVAQWLRIHLPMQGTMGLSPGLGRSHMLRSN